MPGQNFFESYFIRKQHGKQSVGRKFSSQPLGLCTSTVKAGSVKNPLNRRIHSDSIAPNFSPQTSTSGNTRGETRIPPLTVSSCWAIALISRSHPPHPAAVRQRAVPPAEPLAHVRTRPANDAGSPQYLLAVPPPLLAGTGPQSSIQPSCFPALRQLSPATIRAPKQNPWLSIVW